MKAMGKGTYLFLCFMIVMIGKPYNYCVDSSDLNHRCQHLFCCWGESEALCTAATRSKKQNKKKNGDYPTERKKRKKEKKNKEKKTTTTAQHLPVPLDQHLLELIG